HVLHSNTVCVKGGADAPGVFAAGFREISLSGAPPAERVGNIRKRRGMTHDHDLAAAPEKSPDRLVGRSRRGYGEKGQGQDETGQAHQEGIGRTSTRA